MQNSPSKIRVLTPQVEIQGNKYLSCLWMAVQKFAVEVDTFSTDKDNKYDLTQVRAGRKIGNIIHIHWINGFCNFKDYSGNIWISRVGTLFLSLKNLLALSLLKLKGYKIVWTIHNSISHGSKVMLRERLFRRGLSSLCSDILVMSEYSRQQFSQIYGRTHRVHIVPHGNYIGAYPNEISLADARNKLDIPVDAKVFLHIGLIRGYKGINDLIDAFKQIDDNNCFLLIAGACLDADLRQEIELAAKNDDRVRLHLEFINDSEIQIYINACNWVVLPYKKILNSGSALLALSFSRPVIVPQRGSLTELIIHGQQGFTYVSDDELPQMLKLALSTPQNSWQQMCEQAYTLAKKFDWSDIGAQLYQIYQKSA